MFVAPPKVILTISQVGPVLIYMSLVQRFRFVKIGKGFVEGGLSYIV